MLGRLKVRGRLILGFGVLLALIVALAGVSLYLAGQTERAISEMRRTSGVVISLKDLLLDVRSGRVAAWSYLATGDPQYLQARDDAFNQFGKDYGTLEPHVLSPRGHQLIKDFDDSVGALEIKAKAVDDLKTKGGSLDAAAMSASLQDFNTAAANDQSAAIKAVNFDDDLLEKANEAADDQLTLAKWISLGASILAIVIGAAAALIIGQSIASPVREMSRAMGALTSAVSEASAAVSQVSSGVRDQNAAVNQVGSALAESAKAIHIVSDSSSAASKKGSAAAHLVERGQVSVEQLARIVETIAQNSRKINQITQVIASIANRTHILSLNAAIEAARAGEHGKGFVVVAQEVGKLAESSAQNAQQITDIVEQATADAAEGRTASMAVKQTMDAIAGEVSQTSQMIRSIAVAMEEQQASVTQIDGNLTDLRGIASGNAVAAEEIAATMIQLTKLADEQRKHLARLGAG